MTQQPYKAPAAPYETAMVLEASFHSRRMRQKVEVDVYTPEAAPLSFAGDEAGETVRGLLAHKGIGLHTSRTLTGVDAQRREISFDDGATEPFQLLVAIPEHRAPGVVREAGLTDETGWVPVDRLAMRTQHENVYAIGDVVHLTMPNGSPYPNSGCWRSRRHGPWRGRSPGSCAVAVPRVLSMRRRRFRSR